MREGPGPEITRDICKKLENVIMSDEHDTEGPTPSITPQPAATPAITFPQNFEVKYLGFRDAGGLWGIKHTRRPVDELVSAAKLLPQGQFLPLLRLQVSERGVAVSPCGTKGDKGAKKAVPDTFYPIEVISYGVQDLVYTRVFAMIVVADDGGGAALAQAPHPFACHAFVCDCRNTARQLTFALAQAFQRFSSKVSGKASKPKKFAIDLRSPEDQEADLREADSEA